MATQITNYQCPACTGPLHFVGRTGRLEASLRLKLRCRRNRSALRGKRNKSSGSGAEAGRNRIACAPVPKTKSAAAGGSDWDTSGLNEDWGTDAADMKAYSCPSCGAELLCDATTAATSCPYCGNLSVLPGQFAGVLKPDFVLPFKLSKEDAIKALKKHYRKKPLLPSTFSKSNHLEEVKGVYVPFWMYDGAASGSVQFHATTRVMAHLREIMKSRRQATTMCAAPVLLALRKSRWTRQAKCRTTTWIPSNRMTIQT